MQHGTTRTNKWTRALHLLVTGLLVVGMSLAAVGCDSNGGGMDDGDTGEDTTAPAAPADLSGTSQDGAIELDWSGVDAEDLDGYNVYRSTQEIDGVSDLSPQNDSPLSETAFTDDGLENGTTFFYVVTAIDESGNESDPSGEVEKTPFSDPPERPQ